MGDSDQMEMLFGGSGYDPPKGRAARVEPLLPSPGGASSSYCPEFHRIPLSALYSLAERFKLGEELRKGKGSWNAVSPLRESALTQEWVRARLEHVVKHAMIALGKWEGAIPDDGDDDAGAILFGGAVLAEARRLKKEGKL